jgi:uncharacterized protein DUF6152
MKVTLIAALLALVIIPASAQTASELLQKAIYEQDAAGNLDGAIQLYRQIVNSAYPQRDIAAQAQYRLVQALLQKGDLTSANTEMAKLAKDYADWAPMVKDLARGSATARKTQLAADQLKQKMLTTASQELLALQPDTGAPVTVRGSVVRVTWINPRGYFVMEGQDTAGRAGSWTFVLAAPNALIKSGYGKGMMKLGDQVIVTGLLAKDVKSLSDGSTPALANAITSQDGAEVFSRSRILPQ